MTPAYGFGKIPKGSKGAGYGFGRSIQPFGLNKQVIIIS